MKRLMIVAIVAMCSIFGISAQHIYSSKEMVMIEPMVGDVVQLPEQGRKILTQKLTQIATQNGFGAMAGSGVVLTANVVLFSEMSTATVPVMIAIEGEISLVVMNVAERVILSEVAIPIKGIDSNKDRALVRAISSLSPRSIEVRKFISAAREKVIDYYSTRVPMLIAQSKSLSERKLYGEAMAVLATIPDRVDEYPAIADMLVDIYVKQLDLEATAYLTQSQVYEGRKDWDSALDELLKIDPSSSLYASVLQRIYVIQDKVDEEERARLEEELEERLKSEAAELEAQRAAAEREQRESDERVLLEKMRLEAAIEIARLTGRDTTATIEAQRAVNDWLEGKF